MSRSVKALLIDTAFAIVLLVLSWVLNPAQLQQATILFGLIQAAVVAIVLGDAIEEHARIKLEYEARIEYDSAQLPPK